MMSVLKKLNGFREDSEAGFTLMEILVVITIMGVLAAIAIPIFMNQRANSVDDAVKEDVKTLIGTVNSVRANNPNAGYLTFKNERVCTGTSAYPTTCPVTAPKPNLISGGTFSISGGGGESSTRGEFYVSGYHPNANQYKTPNKALFYNSFTGKFCINDNKLPCA